MPEIPHSKALETQTPAIETPETQLEAAFWIIEGFEDFRDITLPSLPDDLRAQLKAVLLGNVENEDLLYELDPFDEGFPVDEYAARALVERYPVENAVATRVETKIETATVASAEANENTEKQAEALQNIASLQAALNDIGINLEAELQSAGIKPESEGGVEAFTKFLEQNAARYLEAAKTRSPWSLVTVYEAVQPFAAESTELTTLLQSYERDYQLSRELLTNPERDLGDIRDAEKALGDSAITEIDGDIIRGEDGEKLDMSRDKMQLSFEGAGGLELEVATIDRPDTREGEITITEKQQQIAAKKTEISNLQNQADSFRELAGSLSSENPDQFDSEDAQARLVRQLLRRFPDLAQLAPLAEATDTGAEFLRAISGFFEAEAENADRLVTVRRAEIAELRQDIGKLQAQIDAKRRLAAEKIRDQKERVRATQALYERLGVSETIAKLKPLLARISPMSPLVLTDGTVVSGINLSTLKITSDRTPGEGGADDFRAQAVLAEIINMALWGEKNEPINFTDGGRLTYRQNGQIVDRYDFDAFVSEEIGDIAFQSKAISRLFGERTNEE